MITRLMKTTQYSPIQTFGSESGFKESIPARKSTQRFLTRCCNAVRICFPLGKASSWITATCLLSATAYLIYLRLTRPPEGLCAPEICNLKTSESFGAFASCYTRAKIYTFQSKDSVAL
jgi:hypothetical protein